MQLNQQFILIEDVSVVLIFTAKKPDLSNNMLMSGSNYCFSITQSPEVEDTVPLLSSLALVIK